MVRSKHATKANSGEFPSKKADSPNPKALADPITPSSAPSAKRPLTFWHRIGWASAFFATATASAVIGATLMWFVPLSGANAETPSSRSLKELVRGAIGYQITRPVNILVMGIDRVPNVPEDSPEVFSGRSDTILLMRIDPLQKTVSVLSIPRDTQVNIPGVGITKVNHANMTGGAELAAKTISDNFEGIEIDRYIRVDTSAFKELVDLLGGVEVYVPKPMKYTDNTQNLHIDLEPGLQVLNGDQAEQFARFRRDANGDIGRVQRQQELIRALREQMTQPSIIPKIPQAIELLQSHIDTNMTLEEMVALANFGMELNRDDFRMVLLPGRFSRPDESVASYWILDPESKARLMRDYFQVTPQDIFVEVTHDVNRLSIAVQNATTSPDLAQKAARYLREQGFRNVYVVQDWPESLPQTEVISQRGDMESAQHLQTLLQLGQVVSVSTGDLSSDLTLRIGEDGVLLFGGE